MSEIKTDIDQYSINVAKVLVMDTVRQADSGHTGGPLSSLDFTYILFKSMDEGVRLESREAIFGKHSRSWIQGCSIQATLPNQ